MARRKPVTYEELMACAQETLLEGVSGVELMIAINQFVRIVAQRGDLSSLLSILRHCADQINYRSEQLPKSWRAVVIQDPKDIHKHKDAVQTREEAKRALEYLEKRIEELKPKPQP